jgi:hypothetical protein
MIGLGRHQQRVSQDRHDPEHWRERAEKARARAEQMHDTGSRHVLLSIAKSYDMMANRVMQNAEPVPSN